MNLCVCESCVFVFPSSAFFVYISWLLTFPLGSSLLICFRFWSSFFLSNPEKKHMFLELYFFKNIYYFMCIYLYVVCTHEWRYPQRLEESIGSSGGGTTGSCELPDVATGNQTLVLWKSNMHSEVLRYGINSTPNLFMYCTRYMYVYVGTHNIYMYIYVK